MHVPHQDIGYNENNLRDFMYHDLNGKLKNLIKLYLNRNAPVFITIQIHFHFIKV
jgi:hypothetical protein